MVNNDSNVKQYIIPPVVGMNMDSSVSQIKRGQWSYLLNGVVENYDGLGTSAQNEPCNEECLNFTEGYKVISRHFIPERSKFIFFLANPDTGGSEIGYMYNNDCIYHVLVNDDCLRFNINHPIHKIVHKITNCSTEIFWADWVARRFMDIDNVPYITEIGDTICDVTTKPKLDCNKLKIQPNFDIPILEVTDVINGGNNKAGTYQFGIQYCDVAGDPYTSYYNITNPTPLFDPHITTLDFNYPVGKSIVLNISNIDVTGYFKYFNVAVVKTINNITSVDLIGTYTIDSKTKQIIYSGQNQEAIKLTIEDIFEKFPYYDIAEDVTTVQDIIVWDQLTSIDRINYQSIASQIDLYWETWRIPATESYADEINSTNLRGYMRDEVYPYEIIFVLGKGKETDGFHIPGRAISALDITLVTNTNEDFIGEGTSTPRWKQYNTATVIGTNPSYSSNSDYKGPYQYGKFSYWESTETYPCNDIYGSLSGQPIRHHKFPDCLVSPIFESSEYTPNTEITSPVMENRAIFPIGVRIDINQVTQLIARSSLTEEQKNEIVGFKIVRGDRATNKSIVAKGILRNVGKYTRDDPNGSNPTYYYYPNYPYNDLREDPFLLNRPNSYQQQCEQYKFTVSTGGTYQYTDCFTNQIVSGSANDGDEVTVCSLSLPVMLTAIIDGEIVVLSSDSYLLTAISSISSSINFSYIDTSGDTESVSVKVGKSKTVIVQGGTIPTGPDSPFYEFTIVKIADSSLCAPSNLKPFEDENNKYRQIFNSPDTSFGNPFLGNILKLENVIFGAGKGHFVEVKKNALYKLITKQAQEQALKSASDIGNLTTDFNSTAMFTAFQSYLTIFLNQITKKNYGWSYNSVASYNYSASISNDLGIKQRELDIAAYLIPGVQSVNDDININNYNRESSIFLKTKESRNSLDYPDKVPSMLDSTSESIIIDKSRYINSEFDCSQPGNQIDLSTVCYYASIKNTFLNQWGQLYSYNTIDTGFTTSINVKDFINGKPTTVTIFGGDTFINKFAFKTKLPFFIDNRVGANDESDIFYDELGNVAFPKFWHSARSIFYDYKDSNLNDPLKNIISIKAHNLDCSNENINISTTSSTTTTPDGSPITVTQMFYDGKMYMFAYGIPQFYCESSVNVDLRQAFNNKEGDFYPHVSTGIPDDWVQESWVPIIQDNTYYYNVSYSKQNKENFFSHLPDNWTNNQCFTAYPFRAIFSDPQQSYTDNRINSWLLYRPSAFFDFPQNFGQLTSLDGIENKQVLARFHNKSLLYNALYTTQTNTKGQVYLGQSLFSAQTPPLDFVETDLGYAGSQHKFLLKIPQGQITIDAKRGQVFLLNGNNPIDISAYGSGLNRFLTDHLSFEILQYFPTVPVDNNFNGIGLHGVYDSKFDRVIISKLDYIPLSNDIKYDSENNTFYIIESPTNIDIKKQIYLTDSNYFCNRSWTLSFNLNTNSWISFHSYIPNFYVAENNFFYSGINESCDLEAIAVEIVPTTTTTTIP